MTTPKGSVVAVILLLSAPVLAQDIAAVDSMRALLSKDEKPPLGAIRTKHVPALDHLLEHESSWIVRGRAYRALGKLGPDGTRARAAWLRRALAPQRPKGVRCIAALAAAWGGADSPTIRAAIRYAFQSPSMASDGKGNFLRMSVITALGWMGPEASWAVPDLLGDLKKHDPDPDVNFWDTRIALGAVGARSAHANVVRTTLLRCLRDRRFGVRSAAATGLSHFDLKKEVRIRTAIGSLSDDPSRWVRSIVRRILRPYLPPPPPLDPQAPLAELRTALRSDDERTLDRALEALAALGPKAAPAVPELLQVDRLGTNGSAVFRVLAGIGKPSVPLLILFLNGRDRDDRSDAASALKTMPEYHVAPAAAALMRAAREGPELFAGQSAYAALARLASPQRPELAPTFAHGLEARYSETVDVCRSALGRSGLAGKRALDAWLERTLSDPKGKHVQRAIEIATQSGRGRWLLVRDRLADDLLAGGFRIVRAAQILGAQGPHAAWALPLLLDHLENDPPGWLAVWSAVGRIGVGSTVEARVVTALTKGLTNRDADIRIIAARWLARCDLTRHAQARVDLSASAHDADPNVRRLVGDVLAERRARLARQARLLKTLAGPDPTKIHRALQKLDDLGPYDRALVPALLPHAERIPARALKRMGAAAVPLLVRVLKRDPKLSRRAAAADLLATLGHAAAPALPTLIATAEKDPHRWARTSAIEALPQVSPRLERALPILTRMLEAGDLALVRTAYVALARTPNPGAALALKAWRRRALSGSDPAQRQAAGVLSLDHGVDSPPIRRAVLETLEARGTEPRGMRRLLALRSHAIRALHAGDPTGKWSRPHLRTALSDRDLFVRYWARRALGRLAALHPSAATAAVSYDIAKAARSAVAACSKALEAAGTAPAMFR